MRRIILSMVVLLVGGCAIDEEMARQRAAVDHAKCIEYGFTRGTQAYAECRMTLDQTRAQASMAASAARTSPSTINCIRRGAWTTCNAY